jgi:hypothetical protein
MNESAKFLECKKQNTKSVMLKIKNKTGVDITPASVPEKAYEQEVILKPGTKYKVINRQIKTFTYYKEEMIDNKLVIKEYKVEALEIYMEEL